ncbi:hypothetical protein [Roseateles sp. P5_E8]
MERVIAKFRADSGCAIEGASASDYFSATGQRFRGGAGETMPPQVEQDWLVSGCSRERWYSARIKTTDPGALDISVVALAAGPLPRSADQLAKYSRKSVP